MKPRQLLAQTLMLAVTATLQSCMHLITTGGGHGQSPAAGTTLVKELRTEQIIAPATIPPLTAGEEATIRLELVDAKSLASISGADIFAHAVFSRSSGKTHDHDAVPTSEDTSSTTHQSVSMKEGPPKGTYLLVLTPQFEGTLTLSISIKRLLGESFEPPSELEATQTVMLAHANHSGGMMGGMMNYGTLGIILAGGLMILMMGWRFF